MTKMRSLISCTRAVISLSILLAAVIIVGGYYINDLNQQNIKNTQTIKDLQIKASVNIEQTVEDFAYTHWNNIALRNLNNLNGEYTSDATLHWIGGPLNGNYLTITQILDTWTQFFNAWERIWYYTESVTSSQSGNNVTISATVNWALTANENLVPAYKEIKTSYKLVYNIEADTPRIIEETWQITGASPLVIGDDEVEGISFSHWDNIAIENLATTISYYTENSKLYWIGGPLDGTYSGTNSIEDTWTKFFKAQEVVWFKTNQTKITIDSPSATINSQVSWLVSSNTTDYTKYTMIKTDYTIVYDFSSTPVIIDETWKITYAAPYFPTNP